MKVPRQWLLLGVLSLLLWPGSLPDLGAQDRDLRISGEFEDLPFPQFAEEIREQTGVTVYFLEEWVSGLTVDLSGSEIPMVPFLDSILQPEGLHLYLDEWDHLFLSDSIRLINTLPGFINPTDKESDEPLDPDSKDLTDEEVTRAEQKYMEGRRIRVPDIVYVGTESNAPRSGRVVVTGSMEDQESGEPLIGATLFLEGLNKGTSTDVNGRFSLVIEPGTYPVVCNSMGMEPLQFTMVVYSQGEMALAMKRTLIPLDEVVVRADRYHNVTGSQMGYERLNYSIFKEVPLVMGERDIINVIKLLPGVQSVGEGSAGFNVRGSGADQNMIYINKVPVYNSSHLFGFFTSFSPEIVADFSLFKSNIPANYGGRLASFFDIRAKQGNMKRFAARGGISSISTYVAAEGPIRKDKSSLIVSARSTYSDWILRRMEDPLLRSSEAGFNDYSGVYTLVPNDRTRLKVFGYRSGDRFKLGNLYAYDYGNSGVSADLQHRFNPRISGNFALIYGRYRFNNSDQQTKSAGYQHAFQIDHYEAKADFNWLSLGNHQLQFGASSVYYRLNRGIIEPYGELSIRDPLDLGIENGVESALYIADEITLSDRLTAYAGLRFSTYMSLGPTQVRLYSPGMPRVDENVVDSLQFGNGKIARTYAGLEPRLNLRYILGPNRSVKLSYNRSYQYLFMLSNTVALAPSDQWKLSDYHLAPQYLDQVSAGYYQDIPGSGLSTSLEIYRKWGSRIVEYRGGANFIESPFVESETLQGDQKAYGFEAMIRRNSGALNGWISYAFARSFMQVEVTGTGEQINRGEPYPSVYDRPHSFTLVANYKRGRRLSFSSNLVYMTGRPVTYPLSVYYEYQVPYIHYSDRNQYRIPDYFRIDFSMNMEGNLKRNKLFHSYWMLSVYNLTGRKNAYSVYFRNVNGYVRGYKLSIFGQPIFTLSWNLKLGNYASD